MLRTVGAAAARAASASRSMATYRKRVGSRSLKSHLSAVSSAHKAASGDVSLRANNNLRIATITSPTLSPAALAELTEQYTRWSVDPNVAAVVLECGSSRRAVSGLDLDVVGSDGGPEYLEAYFKLAGLVGGGFENHHVAVVGGSVGLGAFGVSGVGRWCVATEDASMRVDEVRAGMSVVGGASYVLARMPFGMGKYMGLTGRRLSGRSLVHAGLATHYVAGSKVPGLIDELATLSADSASFDRVHDMLTFFVDNGGSDAGWLELEKSEAGAAFRRQALDDTLAGRDASGPSGALEWTFDEAKDVDALTSRLAVLNSPWGARMLASLAHCSPLALKVSFALIEGAKNKTLAEAMRDEYRAAVRLAKAPDFAVGKAAWDTVASLATVTPATALPHIDPPQWPSGSLADVADADVAAIISTPLDRGADGAVDLKL